MVTAGGRVLAVTAAAPDAALARARAYRAAAAIRFDGAHYRRDIGGPAPA
ncbi:MAG TPA: phosphoribosylglycinamide synthetase C domain-containing protein [Minicystis sp.]|nr:phosphoribosylglycinamide synthetase C domain-containing protein [Minicystis sp.]